MATLRFKSRGEMLAFAGVVVVVAIVALHQIIVVPLRRSEENRRRSETMKAALAARAAAKGEIDATRRTCLEPVNQALEAAFPKGVLEAPDTPLTLSGDARRVPFVSAKRPSGLTMPVPSAVFAESACRVIVPPQLAATFVTDDPQVILDAAAKLREQLAELTTPKVFGVADYRCTEKECVGALAWISTGDRAILGVVRVTGPMEHLGYEEDARLLSVKMGAFLAR